MSLQLYDHCQAIIFAKLPDLGLPPGHNRRDEIVHQIRANLRQYLQPFEIVPFLDLDGIAQRIFDEMFEEGVLIEEVRRFAGAYYRVDDKAVAPYRSKALQANEEHKSHSLIGPRYFQDVFAGYKAETDIREMFDDAKGNTPDELRSGARSLDWNSVSQSIADEKYEDIRARIYGLVDAIEQSDLNDRQKRNAIAYARAIEALVDAEDPDWERIVDLLTNRYFSAILNVAAILQLILLAGGG